MSWKCGFSAFHIRSLYRFPRYFYQYLAGYFSNFLAFQVDRLIQIRYHHWLSFPLSFLFEKKHVIPAILELNRLSPSIFFISLLDMILSIIRFAWIPAKGTGPHMKVVKIFWSKKCISAPIWLFSVGQDGVISDMLGPPKWTNLQLRVAYRACSGVAKHKDPHLWQNLGPWEPQTLNCTIMNRPSSSNELTCFHVV
jgi:hypothetical protein